MTKLIYAIALSLSILVGGVASANETQLSSPHPTIAILDTAIEGTNPIFTSSLIFEACVTQFSTCPNGMSEMEGTNSATMPEQFISKNGFDHGTLMASIAVATNLDVKIVFVRIIGSNPNGTRQVAGEPTVINALDWVYRNKDRFNIQAVSMSQGHHNLGAAGTDYCPKTPITEGKIQALADAGIPVFFPAGNNRDYVRIDWPACIPASIAIGATMPAGPIAIYSNHDPLRTDFFAKGQNRVTTVGGKVVNSGGTSGSTVIAATQWATIKAARPNLTYSEIYELLSRTATFTSNSKITSGRLINLEAALKG